VYAAASRCRSQERYSSSYSQLHCTTRTDVRSPRCASCERRVHHAGIIAEGESYRRREAQQGGQPSRHDAPSPRTDPRACSAPWSGVLHRWQQLPVNGNIIDRVRLVGRVDEGHEAIEYVDQVRFGWRSSLSMA
jgi:hypothetical protein